MDQTLLTLVLDYNTTFENNGASKVSIARGQSGLEKRQCTVRLTIFADGITLPPLLVFMEKDC